MKNTKVIANRFSPNTTSPIFFNERHEIHTEIFSALYDFVANPSPQKENLYLLLGESGVGKTTFLHHLHKQILTSKDLFKYLPILICTHRSSTQEEFYFEIVKNVEQSCRENSYRYRIVEQSLSKNSRWLQDVRHIAPITMDKYNKERFSIGDFFQFLAANSFQEKMLNEIWPLLDYIAFQSGIYYLVIFDHIHPLIENNAFHSFLIDLFDEVSKYSSRFFTVVSLDNLDFSSGDLFVNSGIAKLMDRNQYKILRSETDISSNLDDLVREFRRGGRFTNLGLDRNCDWSTFDQALISRLTAEFYVVYVQSTAQNLETFLQNICCQIIDKSTEIGIWENLQQTQKWKQKLKDNRQEVLLLFRQLLQCIDQKKLRRPMVLVLRGYESLIQQQKTLPFTGTKHQNFILPSSSFIAFYNCLQENAYKYQNIKIISVIEAPIHEFPIRNKLWLYNLLTNSLTWKLKPFTSHECNIFLRETFSRSGLLIKENTIQDFYEKSRGLPIHLHVLGYYVINKLETKINDKQILQANLMTKNVIDRVSLGFGHLRSGLDGRIRLEIGSQFYEAIRQKSLSSIYQDLWTEAEKKLTRKIVEILLQKNETIFDVEKLLAMDISEEKVKYLEEIGLGHIKHNQLFVHEATKIKTFLLQKKVSVPVKENIAGASKIIDAPFRLSSEKISELKNKHKLRPTQKKEREISDGKDTKTFEIENLQEDVFFKHAFALFRQGIFPPRYIWEKMSFTINQKPEAWQEHIKKLCHYLCSWGNFSEQKYKLPFLQFLNDEKNYDLLTAIDSIFLEEKDFEIAKQQQDYQKLHQMFLLKYRIENTQSDLNQVIEYIFLWLEKNLITADVDMYMHKIYLYIEEISDETKKKSYITCIKYYEKLLFLCNQTSLGNSFFESMPEVFERHLIKVCHFLIQKNVREDITVTCLELLSQYSYLLEGKNEITEEFVEILPTHKSSRVRYYFYNFLLYTLPFFEKSFCKEIFVLLLEALSQENELVRSKISQVINSYPLLMPDTEILFLLQNLTEGRPLTKEICLTLTRLAKTFPYKTKQDLHQKCCNFYLKYISSFESETHSAISFANIVTAENKNIHDYICDHLEGNIFQAKDIALLLRNFSTEKETQNQVSEKIETLLLSDKLPDHKKALTLACNPFFNKASLVKIDTTLLRNEILRCQLYFFTSYSIADQLNIVQVLLEQIQKDPLLIREASKVMAFLKKQDIKKIEGIIQKAIIFSGFLFLKQELIRHSCHITIALPKNEGDLNQLLIQYLQDLNHRALFPSLLEGILLTNVKVDTLQICVSNLLQVHQAFSVDTVIRMYDFFNQALDRNLDAYFIKKIEEFISIGINDSAYASVAIPIYLKQFNNHNKVWLKLDIYKDNMQVWDTIVALQETFSEKYPKIAHFKDSCDRIRMIDAEYLDANLICFYYRSGMQVIAEERLNSAIKNAIIPFHLRKFLMIKQEWSMRFFLVSDYVESSTKLGELNVNSTI